MFGVLWLLACLPGVVWSAVNFSDSAVLRLDSSAQLFNGEVRFTDFQVDFQDTGDGLLQFDEILNFSGVDAILAPLTSYTDIAYVPEITGVSTASGAINPDFANIPFKKFDKPYWPRVDNPFDNAG